MYLCIYKDTFEWRFLEMIAHIVLFCIHNFDHCAGTRTIIECKKDVPKDILYLSISFSPKMSKSFFIMFSWVLLRVIVSKSFLEMQEKTIIRPFYSLMDSFIYIYGIEFFLFASIAWGESKSYIVLLSFFPKRFFENQSFCIFFRFTRF